MTQTERQNMRRNIQIDFSKERAERSKGVIVRGGELRNENSLIGECLDVNHPALPGRVLVSWQQTDGNTLKRWLPTLQNLPVRKNDRLVLLKPANWDEMIVTGVVDGYAKRPEIAKITAAQLKLERDEAVRVTSRDGKELFELIQTDNGPTIRVLQSDTAVEFPGRLKFSADSIEMEAGAGPIHINASDDVCINGEMIHLNKE